MIKESAMADTTDVEMRRYMEEDLRRYYDLRAPEFDETRFDQPPEYLRELAQLGEEIEAFARGRRILELACGTGHWTQFAARTARSVLATDASEPMLTRARARGLPSNVEIARADAFAPPMGPFDGVFAVFWLSHVPRARLHEFLGKLPAGEHLFVDNQDVREGIARTNGPEPDRYKRRRLRDGSEHRILKNYFTPDELRALFPGAQLRLGRWLWQVTHRL
jgi:SAM-dependent methyltransferase